MSVTNTTAEQRYRRLDQLLDEMNNRTSVAKHANIDKEQTA
ncbi:MAG: hypothetical protein R2706_11500 [Acidimicrobiales bacterium]